MSQNFRNSAKALAGNRNLAESFRSSTPKVKHDATQSRRAETYIARGLRAEDSSPPGEGAVVMNAKPQPRRDR